MPMCFICDGGSPQELFELYQERIARYGFTMVSVGDGVRSWTYTIGLIETFGHPELVVTTLAPESAAGLLSAVVNRVREGDAFAAGLDATLQGHPVRFGAVHPTQWVHGRFAAWVNYYGEGGSVPANPEAVQVLWPNEDGVFPPGRDFCRDHRHCQPLLGFPVAADVNETARRRRRKPRR